MATPKRLLAVLTLSAMLVAGCGSGGTSSAKVEASLRDYLAALNPQTCSGGVRTLCPVFPIGAGAPTVVAHSCKRVRGDVEKPVRWSCVITFAHGKVAQPVAVAVRGDNEVYSAIPITQAPPLRPATVYEGGP